MSECCNGSGEIKRRKGCAMMTSKTGEFCSCGYEFVIFPDGEDERDLAATISILDNNKLVCIDCAEHKSQAWHT